MKRFLTSLLLAFATLTLLPPSASATNEPTEEGNITGVSRAGTIDVWSVRERTGVSPRAQQKQARPASSAPTGPLTLERYVYSCPGNTYSLTPAVNVPCETSFQFCPPGQRQFYRYTTTVTGIQAVPGPGPGWILNGVVCLPVGAGDPAAPDAAPVPVVTLADFRSLPLPAARPTIQPTGGQALIRMRTNTYVDPDSTAPQTFDITLLGTPVQVRATPVNYTWDYGDGSDPVTTDDPGAPYPDLTTWHEYERPGDVAITLTTTYTGQYSVAGGLYLNIPGTVDITSAPVPLELLRATNRLTG